MALSDLKEDIDAEVSAILSSDFTIDITQTKYVPTVDDPAITYPNLVTMEQRCKVITTCVLHVDIRNSTSLGSAHDQEVMAGLYSAFVRGMARCASYYSGHLRSIIGDRVTVFWDTDDCFDNAVHTAILMNSFAKKILNRYFTNDTIECGIGLDYGAMLVAKVGIIKHGSANTAHKDLVWLGGPANVASKLADIANKSGKSTRKIVNEGLYYQFINEWSWSENEMQEFLEKLKPDYRGKLTHSNPRFMSFHLLDKSSYYSRRPLLITQAVYDGFKAAQPNDDSFTKNLWRVENVRVPGYSGKIYGGDIIFTVFD